MRKIYNELRSHEGKLSEFANYLVEKKVYNSSHSALQALRQNVKPMPIVNELYAEWRPGRLKTKDMKTYVEKTQEVFKEIKQRTLKQELQSIVDVMEEALKELTLGIKNMDKERLLQAKELLSNGLYGGN
ncbi:MAG: hypothetical protein EOM67_03595 [Spirochaetia bacterium]|nr:hypothetical protein [Spirochaetia bacterium]